MTNNILKNIASEDIDDLLVKIEKSFCIKFNKTELTNILTFGELCDLVAQKIKFTHNDDCTTQQAFYKLRDAISITFEIEKKTISPDFSLIDLLPRRDRLTMTRDLEKYLGIKLNILRPPHWLTVTLFGLLLISLFGLYFAWKTGISGLVLSIFGLWIANKKGIELDAQNVGDVAEKMARENYMKSRRNSTTFNESEIEKVLTDLFSIEFGIEKSKINRETKFV